MVLPMDLSRIHLVRLRINGQNPFVFLVGPEAPTTLVEHALVAELKLKPQSDRPAYARLELEMAFGAGHRPPTVTASDLSQMVQELGPSVRPRGIISASLWPARLVMLDYSRFQVTVEAGSLAEPDGRDVFSLKNRRHRI